MKLGEGGFHTLSTVEERASVVTKTRFGWSEPEDGVGKVNNSSENADEGGLSLVLCIALGSGSCKYDGGWKRGSGEGTLPSRRVTGLFTVHTGGVRKNLSAAFGTRKCGRETGSRREERATDGESGTLLLVFGVRVSEVGGTVSANADNNGNEIGSIRIDESNRNVLGEENGRGHSGKSGVCKLYLDGRL